LEAAVLEVILKRFDQPDEVRTIDKGKFELVNIGGVTIGRATYEPGWKWTAHVGKALGKSSCDIEHVGIVVSGRCAEDILKLISRSRQRALVRKNI
jgi:hypothetical protein